MNTTASFLNKLGVVLLLLFYPVLATSMAYAYSDSGFRRTAFNSFWNGAAGTLTLLLFAGSSSNLPRFGMDLQTALMLLCTAAAYAYFGLRQFHLKCRVPVGDSSDAATYETMPYVS